MVFTVPPWPLMTGVGRSGNSCVERPAGTHLSRSSTPGGYSTLARNDDNELDTHAVLFPAENVIKVAVAAGIVVGLAAAKVAPYVKNGFHDLTSKLSRKAEGAVEGAVQEAEPEQFDMGVEQPRSENRRLRAV